VKLALLQADSPITSAVGPHLHSFKQQSVVDSGAVAWSSAQAWISPWSRTATQACFFKTSIK